MFPWILETAKDIDAKLCEYAEEAIKKFGTTDQSVLKAQEARIELLKRSRKIR